jgi:fibro-slime domain-containing protein
VCVAAVAGCGGGGGGGGASPLDGGHDGGGSDDDGGVVVPGCGNGVIDDGEVCDDGNATGGDGCSADCLTIETGFYCTDPGIRCMHDQVCGNGFVETGETCDDRNTTPADGCDANCMIEPGWACAVPGIRCVAAACGDGIVAGFEECDDGNSTGGDGCSASCTVEDGHACGAPGQPCTAVVCGNGVREGAEQCDDGNHELGDGCDTQCHREPKCEDGTCQAVCGDGVIQPGEACDDGNTRDFDGCSSDCQTVESGYVCTPKTRGNDPTFTVPVVYRDFRGHDLTNPAGHIDFENANDGSVVTGIVGTTLDTTLHKPVYAHAAAAFASVHGATTFDQWYRDTQGVNITVPDQLVLDRNTTTGAYVFDNQTFFPLDNRGFTAPGASPSEPLRTANNHNFSFTSELRYWFTYKGGEVLSFRGDDDVWVFINGHLAVDLGGVHGAADGSITLDSTQEPVGKLDIHKGGTYEAVVFQAERHTSASSYKLTLQGFDAARSDCESQCGDGITASDEVCDDGKNDGTYGSCAPGCKGFGPRCGDGIVQAGYETCDDGVNGGGYDSCTPTCTVGPHCGDGIVQAGHESCDDGNDDPDDGCDKCQQIIQ